MGRFVIGWPLLHPFILCFTEQHLLTFVCIYYLVLPVWSWLTLRYCVGPAGWCRLRDGTICRSPELRPAEQRACFQSHPPSWVYSTACHFKALLSPKRIQEQHVKPVLIYRNTCSQLTARGLFLSIAPDLKSLQCCKDAASRDQREQILYIWHACGGPLKNICVCWSWVFYVSFLLHLATFSTYSPL